MRKACFVLTAVLATGCSARSPDPAPRPPAQVDYLVSAYVLKPPFKLIVEIRGPDGKVRRVVSRGPTGEGSARWSPTGSMLAWVDRSGLHVAKGEGTSPRLLVHDGRCTRVCAGQLSFAWSPDGRKLLVGGAGKQDTRFLVVDMRSGDVKDLVAPRPSVLYRAIDWSSDGSWIAYLRSSGDPLGHTCCDDAVYISRPDGSRARRLVTLLDPIHDSAYASFSPDSRSLAVATCCDAPPQLRIVDLRSGRIQLVPRVSVGDSTPQWSPDSKLFSEGVALVNRRGRIARTLGRGTDVRRWTGRGALVLVKMVETKKHGLRQIVVVSPQARSRPRFVFRLPAIQGLLSIDAR